MIYTKDTLIQKLCDIRNSGWIRNNRGKNDGAVGNTLEDLLGIQENNLPIPNAAEWELKAQRANSSSLTTLLHTEPSPMAFRFVPKILLPKYGWKHDKAGIDYPVTEMSFRQTINGISRTDRGFGIVIDHINRRIEVSFNYQFVSPRHSSWLGDVERKIGLSELDPQPYWGFDDLYHSLGTKLRNCFYVRAQSKRENGIEFFHYTDIMMLQRFSLERFLEAIEKGYVVVDFDARTGHNHGTKIRLKKNYFPYLYETSRMI